MADFYSFESKKITFLRKTPIFVRASMCLDTKVKLQTAVFSVLVGFFSFSKNWEHQGVLLFQKIP